MNKSTAVLPLPIAWLEAMFLYPVDEIIQNIQNINIYHFPFHSIVQIHIGPILGHVL
jgi:hypothetical protein